MTCSNLDQLSRRRFLVNLAAGALAAPFASRFAAAQPASDARRPNILVILADDLGYGDISLQGCKDVATPNIDAIARTGVHFTNGYVSGPVCSPTRAALMSGQYQQRHNDEELVNKPNNRDGLSLKATPLPQRLREAGYETSMIGKWHLGDQPFNHPMERGFDEFYGLLTGGRSYSPMSDAEKKKMLENPMKGDPRLWDGRKEIADPPYLSDAFTDRAVEILKRRRDKPLFMYLCYTAIHSPVQPAPDIYEKMTDIEDKKRRELASLINSLDNNVGRVMDFLKQSGQDKNTLVFFLSDNGGGGTRGVAPNGSLNTPLRGFKGETWEGGIRVPFFAQWPGKFPAGTVYDKPVIQMDITATALALAGLEPKPDWRLDGVNLMPYLTGGKKDARPHDVLYWRFYSNMAVRKGDWKLVKSNEGRGAKPVGPFLYDLSKDIEEKNDLSLQHPEQARELQALWDAWDKEVTLQGKKQ